MYPHVCSQSIVITHSSALAAYWTSWGSDYEVVRPVLIKSQWLLIPASHRALAAVTDCMQLSLVAKPGYVSSIARKR